MLKLSTLYMSVKWLIYDDVIKWKYFPRYWPFVRGIHRSPVKSPHKDQWRGALMLSLICVWINDWVNNREACDLRRYRAHYDVIVMLDTFQLDIPTVKSISHGGRSVLASPWTSTSWTPMKWPCLSWLACTMARVHRNLLLVTTSKYMEYRSICADHNNMKVQLIKILIICLL